MDNDVAGGILASGSSAKDGDDELRVCDTHMPIAPAAPHNRTGQRPYFSTAQRPGNVEPTLTQLVIRLMTKELWNPGFLKNWVP